MSKWIMGVLIVIIIIGGVWYWYAAPTPSVPAAAQVSITMPIATATSTSATTSPSTVSVSTDPTLGDYLVANNGMTLYEYSKDVVGMSMCAGTCALAWPPYTVPASTTPLIAGSGVTGDITTIQRADGSFQVAYKGMPLYYYSKDTKPSDTTGENVGGVWTVAQP